jgi:hypothetical protein
MNMIRVDTDLGRSQAAVIIAQALRDSAAQYRVDARTMRADDNSRLAHHFEKQAKQAIELATSIEDLN